LTLQKPEKKVDECQKLSSAIPKNHRTQRSNRQNRIKNEIKLEAHFPKMHWAKSGMLLVEKKEAKEKIIQKVAKQLVKIRNQQQQTKY